MAPMREIDEGLLVACATRNVQRVSQLLDDGADANCRNDGSIVIPPFTFHYGIGKNPVHVLLFYRYRDADRLADMSKIIQILELLHLHGCDLDARDGEQWAPLTFTLRGSNDELTKWLLIHGATEYSYGAENQKMDKKVEELRAEIEQEKEETGEDRDFDCLMVEI